MIPRTGYTYVRKNGTVVHVPETMIKDVGLPGKGFRGEGKGIGKLKKNVLAPYGYFNVKTKTEQERHDALMRAMKNGGVPPMRVFRGLIALSTYNKYKNPELSKIARSNADYVKQIGLPLPPV